METADVVAAALIGLGPTLAGVAALVQSTRARREAAAVNRAVNHVEPGQPTLYQHVERLASKFDVFEEYQHGRNHDLGNAVAALQGKQAVLDMKVTAYMEEDAAAHQELRVELGRIIDGS